jgi:hypothetical protein
MVIDKPALLVIIIFLTVNLLISIVAMFFTFTYRPLILTMIALDVVILISVVRTFLGY